MGNNTDSPYGPWEDFDSRFKGGVHRKTGEESYEVIDANTLKAKYNEQRAQVVKADGNTAQLLLHKQATKKTKALTTDKALYKDFDKIIIYCPGCTSYGGNHRMMPHKLETLLSNPNAYAELVGGLSLDDSAVFLHCTRCNLMLLPSVDEVEKLDVREEDEYEISSLADVTKRTQKPVIAGQSNRYNKAKTKREEIYNRRKRQAQEQLSKDYEHQGVKPE